MKRENHPAAGLGVIVWGIVWGVGGVIFGGVPSLYSRHELRAVFGGAAGVVMIGFAFSNGSYFVNKKSGTKNHPQPMAGGGDVLYYLF